LAALVASTATASAAPIVDSFSTAVTGNPIATSSPQTVTQNNVAGTIGTGTRVVMISVTGGASTATLNLGGGFANFSGSSSATTRTATLSLTYTPTSGTFAPIASNNNITLNFVPNTVDVGAGTGQVAITLIGGGTATVTQGLTQGETAITPIPLSSFSGVNPSALTSIQFTFTLTNSPNNAQGLIIDGNNPPQFAPTPDVVPEPMTLATFGFLTLFGGYAARRKLKAAAVAQA